MKKHLLRHKRIYSLILAALLIFLSTTPILAADTAKMSFSDINLETYVPNDLVTFTRTTSYNNSKLKLIGVSNIEELKSLMITNNVYLEAVPEDVSYEIIVNGKNANNATDFDQLSEEDLNHTYDDYIAACSNIDNTSVTETITNSSIYKTNNAVYFMLDVKSIANNNVTVYLRKYYTVKMGKVITFNIQSDGKEISEDGLNRLASIVDASEYKTIKKSLMENEAVSEIGSTLINILIPIAVLGIIFVIVKFTTQKSQKEIKRETERLQRKHQEEQAEIEAKKKQDTNSDLNK